VSNKRSDDGVNAKVFGGAITIRSAQRGGNGSFWGLVSIFDTAVHMG
jgi:hypothetical protein